MIDVGFYLAISFAAVAMVSSFAYIYLFFQTSNEAANRYVEDYTKLSQLNDIATLPSSAQGDQSRSSTAQRQDEANIQRVKEPPPGEPDLQQPIPAPVLVAPRDEPISESQASLVKDLELLRSVDRHRSRQLDVMAFVSIGLSARLMIAGICLNSCGLLAGVSFAFLGFALFLVGVKGDMDLEGKGEEWNIKVARMSPGAFAIFCATILIWVSVTDRGEFRFTPPQPSDPREAVVNLSRTLPGNALVPPN